MWALLHGMAALYLDRFALFDLTRATNAAMNLIQGGFPKVIASSSLPQINERFALLSSFEGISESSVIREQSRFERYDFGVFAILPSPFKLSCVTGPLCFPVSEDGAAHL